MLIIIKLYHYGSSTISQVQSLAFFSVRAGVPSAACRAQAGVLRSFLSSTPGDEEHTWSRSHGGDITEKQLYLACHSHGVALRAGCCSADKSEGIYLRDGIFLTLTEAKGVSPTSDKGERHLPQELHLSPEGRQQQVTAQTCVSSNLDFLWWV